MNWYKKASKKSKTKNGDCYVVSGRYILNNHFKNPNLVLVHGWVTGQGAIQGIVYDHAWIEDGDMCIDQSNNRDLHFPKQLYYALGNIDPNKQHRYTYQEVYEKTQETGHWGPWQ